MKKLNEDDSQKWKPRYIAGGYLVSKGYIISTLSEKVWLTKGNNKVEVKQYNNNMQYTRKWAIVINLDNTFTFKNTHYPSPILISNGIKNSVGATGNNNSDNQKFYLIKDPLNPNIENLRSLVITLAPQPISLKQTMNKNHDPMNSYVINTIV